MPGGTRLEFVTFPRTPLPAGEKAQVAIYTVSSLTDSHTGGGLVRVASGCATLDSSSSS